MSAPLDRDALTLDIDDLRYTLERAPTPGRSKVVVAVARQDGVPLRDRVDVYAFKARQAFAALIAETYGLQTKTVLGHLAVLLDQIERARATDPATGTDPRDGINAARREQALDLLRSPDLLDRAAEAMTAQGYVGEERNKRLAYLVASSRLLQRPLSAILLASSGAGKSELLEVVSTLLPPSEVQFLSRISPAALYYAGSDALRHKLVVVDEQAGSAEADYAIRTLQSKGLLRLAVPVRGRTEAFEAHGPIALMSGTTSTAINPENLSRCLQLALDDSPEQTRRIQRAQRQAWTGQGRAPVDTTPWHDAQLLLQPAPVVIPFAERLTFPARTTHDRRGNQKLLGLVAAHALLHQHQRPRDADGRIVASDCDYAAVYALLAPCSADLADDMSSRAARAYAHLAKLAGDGRTRREIAQALGWSYNTAKRAMAELCGQELATATDPGPPVRYRLLDRSALGAVLDLVVPGALPGDA